MRNNLKHDLQLALGVLAAAAVLYALFRGFVKARLSARRVPPRKWRDP